MASKYWCNPKRKLSTTVTLRVIIDVGFWYIDASRITRTCGCRACRKCVLVSCLVWANFLYFRTDSSQFLLIETAEFQQLFVECSKLPSDGFGLVLDKAIGYYSEVSIHPFEIIHHFFQSFKGVFWAADNIISSVVMQGSKASMDGDLDFPWARPSSWLRVGSGGTFTPTMLSCDVVGGLAFAHELTCVGESFCFNTTCHGMSFLRNEFVQYLDNFCRKLLSKSLSFSTS